MTRIDKLMKKLCFCTLLTAIALVSYRTPVLAGLGIAPGKLELTDVLKGSTRQRSITVFNTFSYDCDFSLYATGDAKKWLRFYDSRNPNKAIRNIKIGADKSKLLLVKIKVPSDSPNGQYKSKIIVEKCAIRPKSQFTAAGAALRMPCFVTIGVTGEQILDGEVSYIYTRDVEIGNPLKIIVGFANKGNVKAKPAIDVEITQAGVTVDRFTYAHASVGVEGVEDILVKRDTKGRSLGEHLARVTVSLGEKELDTKNLPFKILPYGALSRRGFLEGLFYKGKLQTGMIVKVLAKFQNNGKIDTEARFIGEVYHNGDLVEKIESEEVLVPIHETRTLESYLKLDKAGVYEVKGHVSFEGKKSNTKKLFFRLGYPLWIQILFFGGIVVILSAGIWFFVWRPRKAVGKHTK